MQDERRKTNQVLTEAIGPKNGYFGRVSTWGQDDKPYAYIGFEFAEDFAPTLYTITESQHTVLKRILMYFQIHMRPLKNMLSMSDGENMVDRFSTELAWSHFSTVIMFGMLEIAVRASDQADLDQHGNLKLKGKQISVFLEKNLSEEIKQDITRRYSNKGTSLSERSESFTAIIDHLWAEIRSGFVHEGSVHSIGLENIEFSRGAGTKEDPIEVRSNVPMWEWLQVAWQAILNSYGYKGKLVHPKITPTENRRLVK